MTDITLDNGGTRLAASIYGPAAAEPILFLHGISLSRDTWEEIAKRLMGRHSVWTLDFRGHGHSDWVSRYDLAGYVSDADTALAAIGRPAIVVGHSLGGCVAGVLAQGERASVRAVFLEEPAWYLGEPREWDRSAFPGLFDIVSSRQAALRQQHAPLAAYVDFITNAPSPMGGTAGDHLSPRHLLSHGSALQRHDGRCWLNVPEVLADIATERPFCCPAKIIQADPRFGAALLDGHEARLARTNPLAEIVRYRDCGHSPHRTPAFEERFMGDLLAFVSTIVSH